MSDLVLQRVSVGDPGSVRECIDRFGGLVWSLARRMTYTEAEADDAVQEIFIEIWKNAGRYDVSVASETAFVAMIARRRLIDRRRKRDRQIDRQSLPETPPAIEDTGERQLELADEAKRAAEAMEQLSAEQQRVLRLSIFQGLSHEKIATSTGLPMGTVKTHVRRGLMKLREILGPQTGANDPGRVARQDTGRDGAGAVSVLTPAARKPLTPPNTDLAAIGEGTP